MNKHMLAFEKLYVFNELIRRFVIKLYNSQQQQNGSSAGSVLSCVSPTNGLK